MRETSNATGETALKWKAQERDYPAINSIGTAYIRGCGALTLMVFSRKMEDEIGRARENPRKKSLGSALEWIRRRKEDSEY